MPKRTLERIVQSVMHRGYDTDVATSGAVQEFR
ncbi:hypothetical protein V1280_003468 [Bradyrhizobium sp. AZCC 2230]